MNEIEFFEEWKHKYMIQNPPPTMRKVAGFGWAFYAAIIWAVSAVIMVSTRTMSEFHKAEILSGMNPAWANISSGNVLIAIEGGLIITSALKAYRTKEYNLGLLKVGAALIILISVIAGINSSIGVLGQNAIQNTMSYLLVFGIGIGGSLIAWVSGEVLGSQMAIVLEDRDIAAGELDQQMEAYNDQMLSKWTASDEYAISRKDVRAEAKRARAEVKVAEAESEASVRSVFGRPNEQPNRPNLPNIGTNVQRTRISDYIVQIFNVEGRIPGPTEISRALDVSKAYAKQVIDEWKVEHSDVL